jgi:NADH dehydrogenase
MAELATDPKERAEWLTFVVIGAGPTGVELVGQIAELAHKVLPRDYRSIDTTEARIVLVEGTGAVLPPFPPKLRQYACKRLEQMGVEVRLNTLAVDMNHDTITLKGQDGLETIKARSRIWAAGVKASPLAATLAAQTGAELDRARRVSVNPDCTLPGHPEVFAIGDMMSLKKLPGVAQVAMQQGTYVGNVIKARLAAEGQVKPFKYFNKGSMATIGYKAAVADAFGLKFTGLVGYVIWTFVHVLYLIGWGNRLGTLLTWARALVLSNNRPHRMITFERASDEIGTGREPRPPVILPGHVEDDSRTGRGGE